MPFRPIIALATIAALAAGGLKAQPASLTGYCLDLRDEGCTHRYLPFFGRSIGFCEESCSLDNPVPVRNLEGTLYDLSCVADYEDPPSGRVMILRQTDVDASTRLLWIDDETVMEIVPCAPVD